MLVTAVVGHADGCMRWSGYQAADKEICTRSIWENASKNETHKKRRVEISSLTEQGVWSKPRVNSVLSSPLKWSWRVCKALNSVFRTRMLVASALLLALMLPGMSNIRNYTQPMSYIRGRRVQYRQQHTSSHRSSAEHSDAGRCIPNGTIQQQKKELVRPSRGVDTHRLEKVQYAFP